MSNAAPLPWCEESAEKRPRALVARAQQIRSDLSARYEQIVEAYCVYGDAAGLGRQRFHIEEMRRNRTAEGVDSVAAELCQGRPRVVPEAVAADYELRQKAELQGWYYDAKFESEDMPLHQQACVPDALIAGAGFLFVVETPEGVTLEREHPHNVLVDDGGCISSDPPEVLRERRVSRYVLMKRYPKLKAKLAMAPANAHASGRDVLDVVEGWYAHERHVVAVRGVDEALVDEPWPDPIPWAPLRLQPAKCGWWPTSMVLRAAPMQGERNVLDAFRQAEMECNRTRWVWKQGAVNMGHVDDMPGGHLVTMQPVADTCIVLSAPAVPPDVSKRIQECDAEIFDALQANDLFAAGEKPAGLNSGRAMVVYREIRSRRHKPWIEAIGRWYGQIARELARAERRMAERSEGHRVVVRLSGKLREIDFADMDAGEAAIQIRVEAAAYIEPWAELEMLTDLFDKGAITLEQLYANMPLFNFEGEARHVTAPTRLIDAQISSILRDGKLRSPYRYQNLDETIKRGTEAVCEAEVDDVDPRKVSLLRIYVAQAIDHRRRIAAGEPGPGEETTPPPAGPPTMPQGGLPPIPPPGPPGPPPGGGVPMNGGGLPPGMAPPGAPPMPPIPNAA